jgi:glucose/mannose transport system permease protein
MAGGAGHEKAKECQRRLPTWFGRTSRAHPYRMRNGRAGARPYRRIIHEDKDHRHPDRKGSVAGTSARPISPESSKENQAFGLTYLQMFQMPRWHANLRNVLVFTVLFLTLSMSLGLVLALLIDRKLIGHTILRNIFLFPYALSFIVTGVAWRWIFTPTTGINLLFDGLGINRLITSLGGPPLKPGWITDPTVLFSLNDWLGNIFPALKGMSIQMGIPLAMIPVIVAAAWQLSGFAMAMYLAGLATIPADLREAARIDGATEIQIYRKVILPLLQPVTVSTAIILGHVSLKIFDLVFAMTGTGPGFATDVPGIFVFEQTFKATRYNLGAAASVVMLILVSLVIVPYLWANLRRR